MRRLSYLLVMVAGLAFLLARPMDAALACTIDGIASLTANGEGATLSNAPSGQANLRTWAQFTLPAVAVGTNVQLAEEPDKLVTSLPSFAGSRPFLWHFDDGSQGSGVSVTHRFATLGWHLLTVSYYWPAHQRWVQFDSARIQAVAAGDLWHANLARNIDMIFQWVVRIVTWLLVAALAGLAVAWWRRSRRPASPD